MLLRLHLRPCKQHKPTQVRQLSLVVLRSIASKATRLTTGMGEAMEGLTSAAGDGAIAGAAGAAIAIGGRMSHMSDAISQGESMVADNRHGKNDAAAVAALQAVHLFSDKRR